MLEMVLNHFSSIVESSSSSLLLMHEQIVSRGNSTGLGHINILLDLSSTKDFRMLLCMIGMMEKILGLWDANSFFPLLMWGVNSRATVNIRIKKILLLYSSHLGPSVED